MDKRGLFAVSLALVALLVTVAATSYQYGVQEAVRQASLSIDIGTHSFHMHAYVEYANGTYQDLGYHAGSLTTAGLNFIEGILGNDAFANATHYIQFGSLSTSATVFDAGWVNIPSEITTGGLERAEMAYASTGNGVWTLTYQWTASATHTDVQRVGFNWDSVANDGSLAWADTFTPVTLNDGDKLTVVGTTTVT